MTREAEPRLRPADRYRDAKKAERSTRRNPLPSARASNLRKPLIDGKQVNHGSDHRSRRQSNTADPSSPGAIERDGAYAAEPVDDARNHQCEFQAGKGIPGRPGRLADDSWRHGRRCAEQLVVDEMEMELPTCEARLDLTPFDGQPR
jgi:hypothetical protein